MGIKMNAGWVFIGIGVGIAVVAMFAGRFVRSASPAEIAAKRSKYLTHWWLTRDRR